MKVASRVNYLAKVVKCITCVSKNSELDYLKLDLVLSNVI